MEELEPVQAINDEGTAVKILSKIGGLKYRSNLTVSLVDESLHLHWRNYPEKIGCEMIFLKNVAVSRENEKHLHLSFIDFSLELEFETEELCRHMSIILSSLMSEAAEMNQAITNTYMHSLRNADYQITTKHELLFQQVHFLKMKEATTLMEKFLVKAGDYLLRVGFQMWTKCVRNINTQRMNEDKWRWRLHAVANQDLDLQAWDAVLPIYRNSYDLVDNALTPLEEAALAHVLCSPETSYGDVAGQMFVVQALVKSDLFAVFQRLAAQGAQVIKYPRTGRPAKKMFRFSFVEGNIYLTWRGKFGNQGVDLSEVTAISAGITTDVLRKAAQPTRADQYLSVICAGRSVDLCFDTVEERNDWKDLLHLLAQKEHGELVGLEPLIAPGDCGISEWLLMYSAVGEKVLPIDVRREILKSCFENAEVEDS